MRTIFKGVLIIACLLILACTKTEKKANQFTLIGRITDQDTGTLVLEYGILSTFHSDTLSIENGSFQIKGNIDEPTRGLVKYNSHRIEIYLEPRVMKMTLSTKDFSLKGSKTYQELIDLNKSLGDIKNKDSVIINFVLNNPKSYLVPHYLFDYRNKISLDSLKMIFNKLDISVQESRYGKIIRGYIRGVENTTEGNFASNFKAIDQYNQPLTLSQFKNKNIVLLDFWASWCVHCRESIPHLKSIYKQYHSKGLEIISVSAQDESRQTWESAIKEDSTNNWHQLATYFDKGGVVREVVNEDLIFDYPLGPIPRVILIDMEGKVVGNWVGSGEENEISLDKKLDLVFNR
jgi:thiol-disulfide isomerase/thioredoxin